MILRKAERNGDYLQYAYDAVNRLTGVERLPHSTSGVSWIQAHTYDAVGSRLSFSSGATGPVFDTAKYDVDACAVPSRV